MNVLVTMPDSEVLWRTRRIAVLLEHISQRSSVELTENCKEWVALVKADDVTNTRMKMMLNHVRECAKNCKPKTDYEKMDIDLIIADIEYVEKRI